MSVSNNYILKAIQAEQIKLLYTAMPLSILAILINAGILALFQWNVIEHTVIRNWLIMLVIITFFRGISCFAYNKYYIYGVNDRRWLRYFSVGVYLSGLTWGSSIIWLFPEHAVGNQVLVAFVIAGMSAGATASLSYQLSLIITFLSLLLIPLIIRFFLIGDGISIAMGTMSVVFYLMMSIAGMRNNRYLIENIKLQLEAIRHEKILRESEEKYRHIFNSSPLGLVHYNLNGVVTDYNKRFLDLIGISADEINHLNLIKDTKEEGLHHAISESLQGKLSMYEGQTNSIAGTKETDIRMFCRGMHTEDKSISGGVALLEDISEDKRIKKLKDEFISTISHELRTPLTAIRGAVGLLQGGVVGEVSETVHDMLNITNANTERLLLLINDILDIDKIESGAMPFELKPLDVMVFLDEAVNTTEMYAKEHNVTFKVSERIDGIFVLGDQQRLMQVMYNLLSNAAKFSPADAIVEVTASLEKNNVVISVIDSGGGIPKDFQPKVFERFTQADSTDSRQNGGTGLGLSISKGIIEKHLGKIDFTTSDKGTMFSIRLKRCLE